MKQEAKQLITQAIEAISYDLKIDKKEFLISRNKEISTYRTTLMYYSTKFKGKQIKKGLRSKDLFTLAEIGRIFGKAQCTISFASTSFQNQLNKKNNDFIQAGVYVHSLLFGESNIVERNKKLIEVEKHILNLEFEREKIKTQIRQILTLNKIN